MFSNIFSKSKTKSSKYIFNTNVKCSGCVQKIEKEFQAISNISEWNVDLNSPDKPLTVVTDLSQKEVQKLIEKAGFTTKIVSSDTN
ncbi:MAG: heavy-metal-associated domain-containing protein [Candidatus Kapabacteria bacterium]|nr:heavy-metal-associated domain-containing protein [Candidatus Kapabacteria bacterium]